MKTIKRWTIIALMVLGLFGGYALFGGIEPAQDTGLAEPVRIAQAPTGGNNGEQHNKGHDQDNPKPGVTSHGYTWSG